MKIRPFELVLVMSFGFLIIGAVFLMSNFTPDPNTGGDLPPVVGVIDIWGTLPSAGVNKLIVSLNQQNESYAGVRYRYFPPDEIDFSLVNALADRRGPDLLLTSHEKLVEMRRRISPVSYDSFPVRDIKNMYIDGAQIFALSDALYAYPIAVDPLMMYWNRDILINEGFFDAPKTWESFVNDIFPSLIERDFNRTIKRSVVAMGEYRNIRNAFGILSTLILQGGSEGVIDNAGNSYVVRLRSTAGGEGDPLLSAVDFYTRFSKPSNALYSWNRSFSEDRSEFISGETIFYFGYASEARTIENLNPNLSFDIAEIPQGASVTARRTYGKFYGLSMLQSTDNPASAANVMLALGSANNAGAIAIESGMVPVHRALVAAGSNDTYGRVTYGSAAIARGWLNPDIRAADAIFQTMTEDINENRSTASAATNDAVGRLINEY